MILKTYLNPILNSFFKLITNIKSYLNSRFIFDFNTTLDHNEDLRFDFGFNTNVNNLDSKVILKLITDMNCYKMV